MEWLNKFLNIFNLASGRVWQVHKEPGPTSAFSVKQLKGECIMCELSVGEDDIMFWQLGCMAFKKPSDLFWSSASLFFCGIIDKMMQSSFANKDWINVNRWGNLISRSMFVTYIYEQPSYSAETQLCGENRPMTEWKKKTVKLWVADKPFQQ